MTATTTTIPEGPVSLTRTQRVRRLKALLELRVRGEVGSGPEWTDVILVLRLASALHPDPLQKERIAQAGDLATLLHRAAAEHDHDAMHRRFAVATDWDLEAMCSARLTDEEGGE